MLVIVLLDPQFSIDLQLIGGVIILQTLPAVALGLYTRWLHRWGLVAGWAAGMALGLWMLYQIPNPATERAHFGGSAFPLSKCSTRLARWTRRRPSTSALSRSLVNLIVAVIVTLILRAARCPTASTAPSRCDYFADDGDARSGRRGPGARAGAGPPE